MRFFSESFLLATLVACGPTHNSGTGDGGGSSGSDACVGLQCRVTDCAAMNKPPTTAKGFVFAPNGTLPLYHVNVYVPNVDPGPIPDALQCTKCSDPLPGEPIVQQRTDETGYFELPNIPDGDNVPVVITIGKWRRQITIDHVDACGTTTIATADSTLPRSRNDLSPHTRSVDMPKIAISTGNSDALECLILKLGIDPKEIGTDGQDARIHLFADVASGGEGAASFLPGFAGGTGAFADSRTLWGGAPSNTGKLANYDLVLFSCEGAQFQETKDATAMANVKAYADLGGRVFLSHWHNIWIEGNTDEGGGTNRPPVWPSIATFTNNSTTLGNGTTDTIDEVSSPEGTAFATWMMNVRGSTVMDQISIEDGTGKNTCTAIDPTKAEPWVWYRNGSENRPQILQFTTPNESASDERCGKVVFSDMHVSGDSSSPMGGTYPDSCSTSGLTPQEKALAFLFFDISSCVGQIF